MVNYSETIEKTYSDLKQTADGGELATYIPELAHVNPDSFGVHFLAVNGYKIGTGDYLQPFSIQSIAKVFSFGLAFKMLGEKIWERVGVEPSGTPFNSLTQLETEKGIPRNPLINSGALVICDILLSELQNPWDNFIAFVRKLTGIPHLNPSKIISASEKSTGYRNVSLCNFIKSFANLKNEPADVLDFYYDLCSLEMNCEELSGAFMFLANGGLAADGSRQFTGSQVKRINALLQTCGFYDESGEFAFRVGLPGKSGVGGGIVAIHPGNYVISVWSPKLNTKGNSWKGVRFLEAFTTATQLSIF